MGELVVVEGERSSPRWDLARGSWLWGAKLRILMVTDGRINADSDEFGFGLGPVLETLREPFAWWLKIEVVLARRDGTPGVNTISDPYSYHGFRFTQPGFAINAYDQVWFFGDHPGEESDSLVDDAVIDLPQYSPLSDAELRVVAEWMDRGGGVFATGDHGLLGASLCSRIPRVATMRKWTHAQGVPPREGPGRHETYFAVWPTDPFYWEGDGLPQPIRPVLTSWATGPVFGSLHPHPVLCSLAGPIDVLPDHMHEGAVVPSSDVDVGRALDFDGYQRAEYPAGPPRRPLPTVIAHGTTTNPDGPAREFGLISVYDGEAVGCGRVVVDSTWHHWLSMNLLGLRRSNPAAYGKIQAYHRNVALWLATPEQRASMLFGASFGGIAGSPPMAFQRGMGPWEIGRKVLDVIGRTAPQCMVDEMVGVFVGSVAAAPPDEEPGVPPVEPSWSVLPRPLVDQAIVGGIGTSLLDLIADDRIARAKGRRPQLDPDAIRRHGLEGASLGMRLLVEAVDRAAEEIASIRAGLDGDPVGLDPEAIPVPIEQVPLRVVVEVGSTTGGRQPVPAAASLLVRARIGEFILGDASLDLGDVKGERTAEVAVAELTATAGEELTVEVLAVPDRADAPGRVLFADVLDGDPTGWVGWHRPEVPPPWEVWYRVETADAPRG